MNMPTVVVFSSSNVTDVYLIRSLLTREGIASRIRGEMRAGLGGELPMIDARAELLVAARFVSAALEVIERVEQGGMDRVCPVCDETWPSSFEIWWRCAAPLPEPGPKEIP